MLQLRSQVEERTTLTASQTATVDRQGWSVTLCPVESRATRESWVDHLQHDRSGESVNGGSGHREGCARCPGETLPGNAVLMGTVGRQDVVAF